MTDKELQQLVNMVTAAKVNVNMTRRVWHESGDIDDQIDHEKAVKEFRAVAVELANVVAGLMGKGQRLRLE